MGIPFRSEADTGVLPRASIVEFWWNSSLPSLVFWPRVGGAFAMIVGQYVEAGGGRSSGVAGRR